MTLNNETILAVVMFGGLFVWIDVSKEVIGGPSAPPFYLWAFIAGFIGMCWAILTMVLFRCVPTTNGLNFFINALIMFLFWAAGAFAFTFHSPFTSLTNGWIASWVCFFFSFFHVASTLGPVRGHMNMVETKVLTFESQTMYVAGAITMTIVELIAAGIICDTQCAVNSVAAYATAVGGIGIVFPALLLIPALPDWAKMIIAIMNLLWWFVALVLLTFVYDIFTPASQANGYFATWGASIFSMLIIFPYLSAFGCTAVDMTAGQQNRAPPVDNMNEATNRPDSPRGVDFRSESNAPPA